MWTLNVTYDLRKPGRDYTALFEYLKSLGNWCHALESTWFVVTDKSPETVRDEARRHADSNDAILVVRSARPGAWIGLSAEISGWLQKNL